MHFVRFFYCYLLVSFCFGKLAGKGLGRRGSCFIAFLCQILAYLIILFYPFSKPICLLHYIMVIVMITLLAAGDAVWESQPPAVLQSFYGLDKERNAAMANLKMWQSIGNVIQFGIGLCFEKGKGLFFKTYLLLAILIFGYICLVILDFKIQKIDMKKGESYLLLSAIDTGN